MTGEAGTQQGNTIREPFKQMRYFALTLDPTHVGTGGYRLGRVDNTIAREPSTNLPKIPGSSISGVCRAYTAMHPRVNKYPRCAGKGGDKGVEHCGKHNCPVCIGFGFSNGETNRSFQGMAHFSDAQILFFPVHSMLGPVWVTSPGILKEHSIDVTIEDWEKFKFLGSDSSIEKLNFGWLMLDRENGALPTHLLDCRFEKIPSEIRLRSYLLSDRLFSRIVNDNLEVRTSVSIDPETGAAEDKALFTYEAIPRTTVLWFDVTYNNPFFFKIRSDDEDQDICLAPPSSGFKDPFKRDVLDQISYVAGYIRNGLGYFEALGLGGMTTRGFGRKKILGEVPL